jgi:tetratricopeptide (TPR) repeat protein
MKQTLYLITAVTILLMFYTLYAQKLQCKPPRYEYNGECLYQEEIDKRKVQDAARRKKAAAAAASRRAREAEADRAACKEAESWDTKNYWETYLSNYPNGVCKEKAESRLYSMRAEEKRKAEEVQKQREEMRRRIAAVSPYEKLNIDSKSIKKNEDRIQQLTQLIRDYPEGPRKAEIYRRLAELYWEQARGYKGAIMEEYNKKTNKYYELNDPNLPMPELDLKVAWDWNNKAIEICDYIIKKYPNFENIDEVYFLMASNLMEAGQPLRAIRYYTLVVERFSKSRFFADSYLARGEYYFNNNNVFKAMPNYKAIIDKFPHNKLYGHALYKYAWCMYYVGEYEESVKLFQQAVVSAKRAGNVTLEENALSHMVNSYVESGSVVAAEKYFKSIVKELKYFIKVLEKLGEIYFEQKRTVDATRIYKKLLKEYPVHSHAPLWREKLKKLTNE